MRLQSKKNFKKRANRFKEFVFLLLLSIALAAGLFYFRSSLDTRNQAASGNKLLVRISKSYLAQTDSYYLYAHYLKTDGSIAPYTGKLDVQVKGCDLSNKCTTSTAAWGSYQLINGVVKVNLTNASKGTISASFRPSGSDWTWSNTVKVSIGTTAKLEPMKQWWLMTPDKAMEFNGKNNVVGETFKTIIGYDNSQNICGLGNGRMMYFTKNSASGYWGGNVPWLFTSESEAAFRTQSNLLWSLLDWKKQPGWHDTYLTSTGYESYQYKPQNLSRSANFTSAAPKYGRRVSSGLSEFPAYVLAPEFVADGWGVFNTKQQSLPKLGQKMCSITPLDCTQTSCKGFWSAQSDIVYLPGLPTPLMKLTYYEATDNFFTNPNAFGWREDYYFQKGVGLYRIDVKHFGPPLNGKPHPKLKLCHQDADCLTNKVMVAPHITLSR